MNQPGWGGKAVYFALSFWAAFLLFLIQPIISKLLLPLFGGAAAVWIVNLVFFTSFLLFGYIYAHFLVLKFKPKTQAIIHLTVIFIALLGAINQFNSIQETMPALKAQVLD